MKTIKPAIVYVFAFSFFILLGSLFNNSSAAKTISHLNMIFDEPVWMLFCGAGLLGLAAVIRRVYQKENILSKKTPHGKTSSLS